MTGRAVRNNFCYRKQWLPAHPLLNNYYKKLKATHRAGHPLLREFEQDIASCKTGDFNTPYCRSIKRKQQIEEWGAGNHLASWKQVVAQHGLGVSLWGLKQNTIPHVPHRLLKPGHSVPWPDNREFVISKRYWNELWRDELNWETNDYEYPEDLDEEIRKFIAEQDTDVEFIGSAATGVPGWVTEAAATAIANTANNELKPAIHPDHSNPNYDWLHKEVLRVLKRLGPSWAKVTAAAEVEMYKLKQHPLCQGAGLTHCMSLHEQCNGFYNLLARARTIMSVKGVLSMKESRHAKTTLKNYSGCTRSSATS